MRSLESEPGKALSFSLHARSRCARHGSARGALHVPHLGRAELAFDLAGAGALLVQMAIRFDDLSHAPRSPGLYLLYGGAGRAQYAAYVGISK